MIAAWKKFWFSPEDPFNLGAVRFFVGCGGAIFYLFMQDSQPEGFFRVWTPISFYHLLPGPISSNFVEWVRIVWLIFSFLAGLGIAFRFTAIVGALAGLFYNGYDYNFGWVYHSGHIYMMALLILACSRAGDGFHIFRSNKPRPQPSGAYRWPVRLIQCYVVYVFFICGAQKVWYAGLSLDWAFSNSFFVTLFENPYHPPLAQWLLSQPVWVSRVYAAGALLVVELGAPLALLGRRWGLAFFFIWPVFHVLVNATFGIHLLFFSQVFVYTAFLDWRSIFTRIQAVGVRA